MINAHMVVYRLYSLLLTKTVNDFPMVLAKQRKLSKILQQYNISGGVYEYLSSDVYNAILRCTHH